MTSPPKSNLPLGWREETDDHGDPVYINERTNDKVGFLFIVSASYFYPHTLCPWQCVQNIQTRGSHCSESTKSGPGRVCV